MTRGGKRNRATAEQQHNESDDRLAGWTKECRTERSEKRKREAARTKGTQRRSHPSPVPRLH